MVKIKISEQYTDTPGGRFIIHGNWSGEDFRTKYLEKYFENDNSEIIEINFDGTYGFAPSFLEETFGGLVRKYGYDRVFHRFEFISEEDSDLIIEVKQYMNEAKNAK